MKISTSTANPLKHATPALVIGCFEDSKDETFATCDAALGGYLDQLVASK